MLARAWYLIIIRVDVLSVSFVEETDATNMVLECLSVWSKARVW